MPYLADRRGGAIDLILVGYTPERTRQAMTFCDRTFAGLSIRRRLLVVNGETLPAESLVAGWELLRGSNATGEFSGWDEGLCVLPPLHDDDAVLLVNDTVGAHRHLSVFLRRALVAQIRRAKGACVVGFAGDSTGAPTDLNICGMPLPSWISSFCFLLTAHALRRLGGRLHDPAEVASCVAGGSDESRFFSERCSPALRKHLTWWLFTGWYRSERLTPASAERLLRKARCICAELLLSARCLALGIEFRDPARRHRIAHALDFLDGRRVVLLQSFK